MATKQEVQTGKSLDDQIAECRRRIDEEQARLEVLQTQHAAAAEVTEADRLASLDAVAAAHAERLGSRAEMVRQVAAEVAARTGK